MPDFLLFSDGGGERNAIAASACIFEDISTGERKHFLLVLGSGTNNEAEIAAGLLGFSYLCFLEETGTVEWVSDSEYTLKSATQYILNWQKNGWKTAARRPVKNQGLWRAYLELSRDFQITPTHVRGHQGHTENEACDAACNWAQDRGETLFQEHREGEFFHCAGAEWMLLDGQEFISKMRSEILSPEDSLLLRKKFQKLCKVF